MAGLWDRWPIPGKNGTPDGGYELDSPDFENYIYSFAQITTDTTPFMSVIHNGGNNPHRMPMILKEEDEERWLDSTLTEEEVRSLIVPYSYEELSAYPIDKSFQKLSPYNPGVVNREEIQERLGLDFNLD